jgi:GMP synthase (glutamine-hydrolysing)
MPNRFFYAAGFIQDRHYDCDRGLALGHAFGVAGEPPSVNRDGKIPDCPATKRTAIMRIRVFQHVPFEGPANIGEWALTHGHSLDVTKLYEDAEPPGPDEYDLLVVMGGPMNIYEYDKHPWLGGEKRAIARAVEAGRAVLGVCLGAQLIADVLGGLVTANEHKEIGWFETGLTREARAADVFKHFPDRFMAYHWHGDTFQIPPGAVHAARTGPCANQAFIYGRKIVGLQFHIETSFDSMNALIENCADEIKPAPFVQDAETMQRQAAEHLPGMRPLLDGLLAALAAEVNR